MSIVRILKEYHNARFFDNAGQKNELGKKVTVLSVDYAFGADGSSVSIR